MARSLLIPVVVLLAFGVAGCHGPGSECEATIHSYESIVDGNSWDDFADLVYPPQRKKYGDAPINKWLGSFYEGCRSFKFTAINAAVAKDQCLVQTTSKWHQKIRGSNPVDFDDEYNTYTLHLVDGKWYMELPGTAKIQTY